MAKITLNQAKLLFKIDSSSNTKEKYKKAKLEYRKLAREYHPDAGGTNEDFQIIQEAWILLEDSLKKRVTQKLQSRDPYALFESVCKYFRVREGAHISLTVMSLDMKLNASEYMQVNAWLSAFQKMRYILGTKVNFMPEGLTICKLETALEHVEHGNYGDVSDIPISVYRALAKTLRK